VPGILQLRGQPPADEPAPPCEEDLHRAAVVVLCVALP
jgi:hypothetical protein